MNNISLNLEAIEALHFFWVAASEKDQIAEQFFHDIGKMKAMVQVYNEEFNSESIRRALSAIKNREPFSGNKQERKFWNLNMWAMEDLELTKLMVDAIKSLKIEDIFKELDCINNNKYGSVEVYFSPMNEDEYIIKENKLFINFFRIRPSFENDDVCIGELELSDYIKIKVNEVYN